ncbi:MAG: aspartyl protease family protein [Candidatus Bathyarchaeia archaeon]
MGHVWVKAKIGDENRIRLIETDALVDTGATLTVIPRRMSVDLNLKPTGKSIVETGAGRLELERTRVWIELEGKSEVMPALISDLIDKVLIGITALEVLGLQVDPLTGRLKEWALLLYCGVKAL